LETWVTPRGRPWPKKKEANPSARFHQAARKIHRLEDLKMKNSIINPRTSRKLIIIKMMTKLKQGTVAQKSTLWAPTGSGTRLRTPRCSPEVWASQLWKIRVSTTKTWIPYHHLVYLSTMTTFHRVTIE
jgi:hypothetical protein